VLYAECQDAAAQYGMNWESSSETPYWYDGSHQGWYSNRDSLQLRIEYALDEGLSGVGFWALNYDDGDQDLWDMIRAKTTDEEPLLDTPTGATRADAGMPLLAYVGDTVKLNGSASVAGDGGDLSYTWSQLQGPRVVITDSDSATPSFTVVGAGTHSFELSVTSLEGESATDRAYIVVLDPEAGRRFRSGCGCQNAILGLSWLVFLPMGAAVLRRRESSARYLRR
jgi:hypothetical protein